MKQNSLWISNCLAAATDGEVLFLVASVCLLPTLQDYDYISHHEALIVDWKWRHYLVFIVAVTRSGWWT